jgi:tripartite-type tricarboxylate transporter receptor subunit TctC
MTSPAPAIRSFGRRAALIGAAAALLLPVARPATAQDKFPEKPVTLVVPFAAGGPSDAIARLVAQSMSVTLGQQILIENIAGAGGTVAAGRVAKAPADGYTLLIHHLALATGDTLYPNRTYRTLEAFEPIGLVNYGPYVLTVKKDLPVKSAQDLFGYLKANADKATLAHAGVGSGSFLCNVMLQQALGFKAALVAYRGTGPALNDVVAGQVDVLCDQTTNTIPQIKAGTIRGLAVSSPARIDSIADIPTMSEVGQPQINLAVWHALYSVKGTPAPVMSKLNAALETALKDKAIVARFTELGTFLFPEGKRGPAETRAQLAREVEGWAKLIKAAGIEIK